MSDDDIEPNDEPTAEPETPPKRRNAVAWFAVLISAGAFVLAGYSAFNDWRADDDTGDAETADAIEALTNRSDATNSAIAALESKLNQQEIPDFGSDIDALRGEVEEQLRLLNSLPSRLSTLEDSVASLAGISAGARETFLLREAEYYLQIANAQLQLANNPELAALAMNMADERVTQLSNPGLIEVRRAIANELAALDVMAKPDLAGATLTLASLAGVVDSLPLAATKRDGESSGADGSEEEGNAGRAWQSFKDSMSGLVKITPPDRAKLELLSPDTEYFLRNNIAMQLQAARLALLRGEQAVFEQALDDAASLLNTYFDTTNEQVTKALQTLQGVRQSVVTAAAPDISESLRLLRQFKTLRETRE